MSDRSRRIERMIWIAVVAILATSLMWLAAFSGVVLLGAQAGSTPQALVVLRALGRVLLAIVTRTWPILPVFTLGCIMLALASRRVVAPKGKVRHA